MKNNRSSRQEKRGELEPPRHMALSALPPPVRIQLPVEQFGRRHHIPCSRLRALIFNEEFNGFSSCIRRVGRRILLDEAEYFAWLDKINQAPSAARGAR